jgi:hypothetical protein
VNDAAETKPQMITSTSSETKLQVTTSTPTGSCNPESGACQLAAAPAGATTAARPADEDEN